MTGSSSREKEVARKPDGLQSYVEEENRRRAVMELVMECVM